MKQSNSRGSSLQSSRSPSASPTGTSFFRHFMILLFLDSGIALWSFMIIKISCVHLEAFYSYNFLIQTHKQSLGWPVYLNLTPLGCVHSLDPANAGYIIHWVALYKLWLLTRDTLCTDSFYLTHYWFFFSDRARSTARFREAEERSEHHQESEVVDHAETNEEDSALKPPDEVFSYEQMKAKSENPATGIDTTRREVCSTRIILISIFLRQYNMLYHLRWQTFFAGLSFGRRIWICTRNDKRSILQDA